MIKNLNLCYLNTLKLLALLLAVIFISACNNAKEVVFKSGGVTQTFAQGKSAVSADFQNYVYPESSVTGSVSADGEKEEQSKFLMLSSKTPMKTVSQWYREQLKKNNWKIVSQQEQGSLVSITGNKNNTELSVMITEENAATTISLSMDKQVDSNYNDDNNRDNYVPDKETPPTD